MYNQTYQVRYIRNVLIVYTVVYSNRGKYLVAILVYDVKELFS